MKKIICLILSIILVMSSVSVFAREYYSGYDYMDDIFEFDVGDFVAGEETVDGGIDEDTKLMMFLETLGLWDDSSISKNELVSMQEFSKILSKVRLGTDNAFAPVYDLNPTEEYATYNHAYTYLVEALGYSYKCGQYPNAEDANIIVAAEIGLLSERPESVDAYITRGELAKLIYKAMNIDLCVVEYPDEGGYRYSVIDGKTLLNSVHGIYVIEGFVNGIPGLNVYGSDKVRDGYIEIDRREIKNGGIDTAKYFASRVQAYTKYDETLDQYTLIAIDFDDDIENFEVNFRDLSYVNNNEIGYLDETGNEEIYNISNLRYVIENGEALESITDICDFNKYEGSVRFTSSTNSGEIDTAVIYKYNYYVVNNVDTRLHRIVLRYNRKYEGSSFIQLDDKATMDIYIDGVKSDYSQLVSGSIIKFFMCPATGYVYIDAKSMNQVNGQPEMLYDDVVAFGDNEYIIARDWSTFVQENKDNTSIISSQRPKELEIGANTTFYIIDNVIAAYTSSQSYKYGYIKSVAKSRTSLDPVLTFRMFTQDGEWVDFTMDKNVEFEGEANVSKETVMEAINSGEERLAHFFDHPVRFRANADNELLALDTIYESRYEVNTDDDIVFTQYCGMARDWTYEGVGRDNPFFMSESTVIFVAPDGSDDESEFKIITNTQMPSASGSILVPTKIYNLNDYCQISLMVMTRSLNSSSSAGKGYYYVEKISKAVINAEDQIYGYKVSGKQFVGVSRGNGVLKDFYFYADEKMMNKNEIEPGEEGYDEVTYKNNVLEVGDFISAVVSGTDVASWDMQLKGGVVPEPTPADDGVSDKNNTSTDSYIATGKFVRADAATGVWVANVDGVNMPVIPTVKVIINPNTKELISATVSDFIEGDNVYYNWQYGRGSFFIKNEY
ncbi:MAG: hypothetical protein J6A69_06530 [Clostridia bacterium]|nr:hypothetical protein [Clostridia bacterium]